VTGPDTPERPADLDPETTPDDQQAQQPEPAAAEPQAEPEAAAPEPEAAPQPETAPEPEAAPAAATEAATTPRPTPRPAPPRAPVPRPPGAAPRPGPAPTATPTPAAPPAPEPSSAPSGPPASDWGRVDHEGTVFVRTADGERAVGQMPDATPAEALAFFTKRYDDLVFEVELLERRIGAGTLSPDEAASSVRQVHGTLRDAQAVGDLASLDARLDALTATIGQQRKQRQADRARKLEEARSDKQRIADEAERLSQANDWRNGANRMRQLLDEWKALPRLEKSVDDALWRRFSTARTTYTRRRKSHFSELNEKRDEARVVKEKLVVEAEALADSTEWGPTSGKYRDLMRRWKAAGPAPKGVDDQLWKRFRTAQDTFFGNRDKVNAEQDREFAANAEKKEALLVEAEALLPVTDLRAAKESFRDIAERWDAAGKVPRDKMKSLEDRIRRVERAIRGVEDDQWRRSNPEARARAADTVAQLESSIADLEAQRAKAEAAGNDRKAREAADAIEARKAWLTQAQKALEEFSG
jgi:hypothetical protein